MACFCCNFFVVAHIHADSHTVLHNKEHRLYTYSAWRSFLCSFMEKKKKKAHRCEFWRTGYNICFRCTHIWHVFTSFCQFRRNAHFIRTPFPRGALVPFSSLGTIQSHLPRTRNRIVCSVGTHTTFQGVLFPKRNRYHPKQHMPRFIFLTYVLFSSFFFFFFFTEAYVEPWVMF